MSSSVSGSSNVYTQGDLILQFPVEASTTFLFVILISAVLEFCIDFAANVKNKYFQVMFDAMNQEVMIVGVMVLSMSFAQTLYSWPQRWILIFQWAMICLFFMMVFFIVLILGVLFATQVSTKLWLKFEVDKMDSEALLTSRERQYKLAFNKFQTALTAFGYDGSQGIRFALYVAKLLRRNVVSLTDLTWVCWVCLATLVILNTLRSEGTRQLSQYGDENLEDEMTTNQRLVNYVSFALVVGYGTLGIFIACYIILNKRLDSFLEKKAKRSLDEGGPTAESLLTNRDSLEDPKTLLFRRSREATLEILQVIILFLEWYTSVFFVSFSNEIVTHLGIGIAIPLFIFAIFPVIIFALFLPWMLMVVTMLSSLGNNLEEDAVRYLIVKAGIPESDWPPSMRAALGRRTEEELRAANNNRGGTDGRSTHGGDGNYNDSFVMNPMIGASVLSETGGAPTSFGGRPLANVDYRQHDREMDDIRRGEQQQQSISKQRNYDAVVQQNADNTGGGTMDRNDRQKAMMDNYMGGF